MRIKGSLNFFPATAMGALLGLGASGCAGPSTPLGAVRAYFPGAGRVRPLLEYSWAKADGSAAAEPNLKDPVIRFWPSHQILHGNHALTVAIEDEGVVGSARDLRVDYNGFDVTGSFLEQSRVQVSEDHHRLTVSVPRLNLPAAGEHTISFTYTSPRGNRVVSRWESPRCEPFIARKIERLERFKPSAHLLSLIEKASTDAGFNPSFTAGLIAQESSFRPDAVSWARGLGLTQITPIAGEEIAARLPAWPSVAGVEDMPVPILKGLIWTGQINATNDWRLDPARSVAGGLAFLLYLYDRWSTAENNGRVAAAASAARATTEDELRLRLVLASYNAGFTRVAGAFSRSPASWQDDAELPGVSPYVNRIVSLCDRFAQPDPPPPDAQFAQGGAER